MKINSITTNPRYLKGRAAERSLDKGRECVQQKSDLKQNINDQINTTIKSNSDGRVSFKGSVPLLHKVATFASDKPLVAEALFAILITCGLRPLTIMATAKNEEDKEKCSYQAAKSISSGLVGFAATALIGSPIGNATKLANKKGAFQMPPEMKEKSQQIVRNGIDALNNLAGTLAESGQHAEFAGQIRSLTEGGKLNIGIFQKTGKNAQKAFSEKLSEVAPEISTTVKNALTEQKVINNYARTGKNVADKLFQPIFMPLRATVTIALVPILLGLIGKHKPGTKPKEEQKTPFEQMSFNVFQSKEEKEIFQTFSGVADYESK